MYDFTRQPAILIQGAMETETGYLIDKLEDAECITLGNWKFFTGCMGEYKEPVIISRTYQGMVNAAAATSLALSSFQIKAVINQGIAGGHAPELHRGEIVLGEKVVPIGAVVRRYSPQGAGINETDFEPLKTELYNRKKGKTEKVFDFPCNQILLAAAEKVETKLRVKRGVLGSGDEWNNQIDRITLLRERYGTTAEDMESAAAAQLCFSYGIPFLGIRILSNSIVNEEAFDESVGMDCQSFVEKFVRELRNLKGF